MRQQAQWIDDGLAQCETRQRGWAWRTFVDVDGRTGVVVLVRDHHFGKRCLAMLLPLDQFGVESIEQSLRQLRPH